uniref:Venom peptide Ht339 n=1 Tax=Hadogenes troglodytes TaxID=1577150 RepID=A0A1B3IJ89_9SCOR|nr:venom peptide Ht339 [Hadogenes troglodytes]
MKTAICLFAILFVICVHQPNQGFTEGRLHGMERAIFVPETDDMNMRRDTERVMEDRTPKQRPLHVV